MRLLIVVDKLLTGFDAPICTYLYIDKSMQDHGLFQAICRTNRLDGEDKSFGYIVDYKDLFKKLINEKGTGALQVYTSELDESSHGASPEILMQDRLKKGRERLEAALETMAMLCESVKMPQGELEHIHYFCGNTEIPDDLKDHEPQRAALYKGTAALLRAYANIADDLPHAGYTAGQAERIKGEVEQYVKLRAKRISYEQFLKRMADLAKQVQTGADAKTSPMLDTPGKRALYDNLLPKAEAQENAGVMETASIFGAGLHAERALSLALKIDIVVKLVRPADWRGVKARENIIKAALKPLLNGDKEEVERLFPILVAQTEY